MCTGTRYQWSCCGRLQSVDYHDICDRRDSVEFPCVLRGLRRRTRGPCPDCRSRRTRQLHRRLRNEENARREAFEREFGPEKPMPTLEPAVSPPPTPARPQDRFDIIDPNVPLRRPTSQEVMRIQTRRENEALMDSWVSELDEAAVSREAAAIRREASEFVTTAANLLDTTVDEVPSPILLLWEAVPESQRDDYLENLAIFSLFH